MKQLKTTQGDYFKVDDKDFTYLNSFKWSTNINDWTGQKYARTFLSPLSRHLSGGNKEISLHRLILGLKYRDGKIADHINMDTQDNTRKNLRVLTVSESNMNRRTHKNNKSGFKGVRWRFGAWRACLQYQKRKIDIGKFKTKEEAAIAYNEYAKKLFGSKVWTNKI